MTLKEDKALCFKLGSNAKAYFKERFSRDKVLNKFTSEL